MSTKIKTPDKTEANNEVPSGAQAAQNNAAVNAEAEAQAKAEAEAKAKQLAQDTLNAKVNAELMRVSAAKSEFLQSLGDVGSIGLENLAHAVGLSVNANGYPSFGIWLTFIAALAVKSTPYATQDRLFRTAAKAIGTNADSKLSEKDQDKAREKFLTKSAKGAVGQAKASLKIRSPKAWDIALGE